MPGSFAAHSLLARLDRHAGEFPDRTAYTFLRDRDTPETLTFGQVARRVRAVAARLAARFGRGDRAVLLYPQGLEFVCAYLGCLAAGMVAVPAYPPRRNRNADRLAGIVADCTPAACLTVGAVRDTLPPDLADTPVFATDEWPTADAPPWAGGGRPADVAFLQYTSGSTGTPKGVVVTHGNIACNERQLQRSLRTDAGTVNVSWLPLFHDMGLIFGALHGLYVGGHSVLMSPAAFVQNPVRWLQVVSAYRATVTGGPNFAFDLCARAATAAQKAAIDLSSLAVLYNGAEPVCGATLDRFAAAFAPCGFRGRAFVPAYGLAEATLFVAAAYSAAGPGSLWVDAAALAAGRVEPAAAAAAAAKRLVSCGPPAAGLDVRVVDCETRLAVGPGRVGEVWVRGENVAAGYWGRPADTRAVFENRPAGDGGGPYLATGDLGFVAAGEVYITGRVKDLIVVRGRNVYPQDVEAAVVAAVAFIPPNGCAAFAVETPAGGEVIGVVAEVDRGTVRAAKSAPAQVAAVAARIRAAVADAVEAAVGPVVLVRPGSFPRTSSGKVQRRACREQFLASALDVVYDSRQGDPPPGRDDPLTGSPATAGGTAAVQALCRTIIEVFAAGATGAVGSDRDPTLTELARDSIGVAVAVAKLEDRTGVRIGLDAVYEHPTVRRLAAHVARRAADAAAAPLPGVAIGPVTAADEMAAVGALRYAVTVGEMGLTMAHADHRRRVVLEPLDGCGVVLAARHAGEVVGTLRVNLLRQSDVGHYFEAYGLGRFADADRAALSISTRLAIAPRHRKAGLLPAMAQYAFEYLLREGVSFNVMDCRKPLLTNFLQLGYTVHVPDLTHPEFGDVTVLALDVRAAGRRGRLGVPGLCLGPPADG